MASFFFLVIIILLNSWPRRRLLPFSVRIPPRSRFLVLGRHRSLLRLQRSEKSPPTTVAVNVAVAAIVTSTFTSRQGHVHVIYETCSVTDKTSPCRRRPFCRSVTDKTSPCRRRPFCRSVTGALTAMPVSGPEEPVQLLRFWLDQYFKLQQYF